MRFSTPAQHVRIHGLGEVLIESGIGRALLVIRLAPAGQRHQHQVAAPRRGANPARELVTVHARHADVEQRDVGLEGVQHFERLQAVKGHRHLAMLHFEQHPEAFGGVAIVIDHQHALAGSRGFAAGDDCPREPAPAPQPPPATSR